MDRHVLWAAPERCMEVSRRLRAGAGKRTVDVAGRRDEVEALACRFPTGTVTARPEQTRNKSDA